MVRLALEVLAAERAAGLVDMKATTSKMGLEMDKVGGGVFVTVIVIVAVAVIVIVAVVVTS
jgi:hypothetical protein